MWAGRCDDQPPEDGETADGEERHRKGRGAMAKTPRDQEPLVLEMPAEDERPVLEIRGDGKAIVDWVNGQAKLRLLRLSKISCGTGGAI